MKARAVALLLVFETMALFLASHLSLALLGAPMAGLTALVEPRSGFETIADELNRKGVKALAPASIVGKSGVKHDFAFAVVPDSGKVRIVLDTELSVKEVDEMKVLKFYVKVYDVSPDKAVLCVCPKLATRASALAREYGITVLEDDLPKRLIPLAEKVVTEAMEKGTN